jgi:Family of unknown function (DUF5357)
MQITKDLFGILGIFEGIYERIRKILIPPHAYSWQTLIYLSIFSWIMSSLAGYPVKNIIAFLGWVFLIAGTSWYTTDQPILIPGTNMPVGAVITGFLVSVFAFGHEQDVVTPRTIVLWPTIAALITAIPEFFEGSGIDYKRQIPKAEVRQRIIVLVGCCLILSAWIQLYFTVDKWARQYPSLLSDNFSRSAFVMKTDTAIKIPRNGAKILNRIQPLVQQQLEAIPWSNVERWLIEAPNTKDSVGRINTGRVNALGRQVIEDLSRSSGRKVKDNQVESLEELRHWTIDARVNNNKGGYRLDLLALWSGPSSNSKSYYLRKSCQVDPISKAAEASTVNIKKPGEKITVAEVQCDKVPKFFAGSPPTRQ